MIMIFMLMIKFVHVFFHCRSEYSGHIISQSDWNLQNIRMFSMTVLESNHYSGVTCVSWI